MNVEAWRVVPGFSLYEVSDTGKVRSWAVSHRYGVKRALSPRILKPHADHKGYLYVYLGRGNRKFIHHLVLETFVGPRPDGLHACHNDDDRRNNALSNLRWDTPSANREDSRINGGMARGTGHPLARLTEDKVREARGLHATGETAKNLAEKFGVCELTMKQALRKETWKHV